MRDIEIRGALVRELRREHPNPSENRVWSEFALCLGASRVDVCLINGALSGFEIKSPRDNLSRLESQADYYGRVMDFASIVVSGKHSARAIERLPEWWGVLKAEEASDGVSLHWERPMKRNAGVDPLALAQLLWRDEALAVLRAQDLHHGLSRGTRWDVWDRLVHNLSVEQISTTVRFALKARPARPADARLA